MIGHFSGVSRKSVTQFGVEAFFFPLNLLSPLHKQSSAAHRQHTASRAARLAASSTNQWYLPAGFLHYNEKAKNCGGARQFASVFF